MASASGTGGVISLLTTPSTQALMERLAASVMRVCFVAYSKRLIGPTRCANGSRTAESHLIASFSADQFGSTGVCGLSL